MSDNASLEGLDFRDELNGVVVLANDNGFLIYATADGGESWTLQNEFSEVYLTDLLLTPNSGYFTDQKRNLYRLNAPLSTREYSKASFNVYPNPASPGQTLRWESPLDYSHATIFDITGKEIQNVVINKTHSLELPRLYRGIYLVSLKSDNSNQVVKIVVD